MLTSNDTITKEEVEKCKEKVFIFFHYFFTISLLYFEIKKSSKHLIVMYNFFSGFVGKSSCRNGGRISRAFQSIC